ncbi:hypothetical protein LINPERHAP1_LOCUS27288 [Linum perenne]
MAPFDFKSATHFVASSDGITLQVYEFTEPTNNPSSIQKPHFKHVAKICHETSKEEGGAKTTSSYDALLFPEDHGRIEGREGLTMLAQHLAQLHLVVSPQGYCFQDVSEHGMYVDLEIHYLRLNDLFCWSHHGVESMASTTNTVWTRSELKHPVRKGENLLVKPMTRCVVVREDKYKELKGMLRNRDDEMEEMKEELDETKNKNQIANLTREKEIAIVTKDEEVEKLRRETETAIVAKDEEVEKLRMETEAAIIAKDEEEQKNDAVAANDKVQREKDKEIKKKDEEIKRLKKEKDEDIKKKDEEIERLKREKEEEIKKKDEEIERLKKKKDEETKKKDEEIERLKREKDEETKKKDEEIERLKKEKKEEEAKTKKVVEELAKCQKQPSWAFLPSTKLVRQNSETKQKYLERRQRVPPGTFSLFTNFGFPYVSNSANLVDNMSVNSMEYVNLIDEPESNIKEWPPLPTQYVYIGKGSTLDFDTNDWWYLKTTHPEGGLTMLVYYEGKRSQFSHGDKDTDPIIPLPFLKDAQVYSILSKFSLFNLSFGARLGYMYRK